MEIYEAIMKAAEQVEREPDSYRFMSSRPGDCGSPGCALGWIGFMADSKIHRTNWAVAEDLLGLGDLSPTMLFYARMNALDAYGWTGSAARCAIGLRLYAAKYHAPAVVGIPESVREIFAEQVPA